MHIRKATTADIPDITRLRVDMLHEVAPFVPCGLSSRITEYLHLHISNGTCLCALLEDEGQVVSKAMLCTYETIPHELNLSGKAAVLASVYTLPAYRGQGHMRSLLRYLLDWARDAGIQEVFGTAEEKALPLYLRLGFSLLDREIYRRL